MNNLMTVAEGLSHRIMRFYVNELCYEALRDSVWTGFFRSSKEALKEIMWKIIKQGDQTNA
jgi:hypothetical protein